MERRVLIRLFRQEEDPCGTRVLFWLFNLSWPHHDGLIQPWGGLSSAFAFELDAHDWSFR